MKILVLESSGNKNGSSNMLAKEFIRGDQDIDVKTRCMLTVTAIMAQGLVGDALKHHIMNAKNHGVSQKEMAALITHVAFYAGWPKAWAVFNLAKEVYGEE